MIQGVRVTLSTAPSLLYRNFIFSLRTVTSLRNVAFVNFYYYLKKGELVDKFHEVETPGYDWLLHSYSNLLYIYYCPVFSFNPLLTFKFSDLLGECLTNELHRAANYVKVQINVFTLVISISHLHIGDVKFTSVSYPSHCGAMQTELWPYRSCTKKEAVLPCYVSHKIPNCESFTWL